MAKFITSIVFLWITLSSVAQNQVIKNESTANDAAEKCHQIAAYKLFPTENMWTFIKLNTRNGKMWQVQYDVSGDNRFETHLNMVPLVSTQKEVNGRFTLYSTQNMYNFILLDQIEGNMWQVQWSIEPMNRGILPIK